MPSPLPVDDEPEPVPEELEIEVAESAPKSERKLLILALGVIVCIALVHFTPIREFTNDQAWKQALQRLGIWAPAIFFLASTGLIAIGIPRMILCALGAFLFGFVNGFLIGQMSALLGSYLTFLFARWGGREWVAERVAHSGRLRTLLKKPSTFTIFLVRQLPIAGVIPNLVLGMTPVKHRYFMLGSFLGYLPSSFFVAMIGSGWSKGFSRATLSHAIAQISAAMAGLALFSWLIWQLKKKLNQRKTKPADPTGN